jgi:ABC-2 type transport system permease protein
MNPTTFKWLLKREYWEHRGGLLWAPVWTAAAIVAITLFGWLVGELLLHKAGTHVQVGLDLGTFMRAIPDDELPKLTRAFDIGLLGLGTLIRVVLAFVVFFYCIGALYDERRDRSVLFWKSLPISDRDTVLSKLATAAVTAPVLATAATIAMHIVFLCIVALVTLVHGGNPLRVVFGPAEPIALWLKLIASIPVAALWLLPSYGWLLFASSFARSKAFLWAVVPPVLLGVVANSADILSTLNLPNSWIWVHVVARLFPIGLRLPSNSGGDAGIDGMSFSDHGPSLDWSFLGNTLANPETWIGAAVGIGFIVLAIRFRRLREIAD